MPAIMLFKNQNYGTVCKYPRPASQPKLMIIVVAILLLKKMSFSLTLSSVMSVRPLKVKTMMNLLFKVNFKVTMVMMMPCVWQLPWS